MRPASVKWSFSNNTTVSCPLLCDVVFHYYPSTSVAEPKRALLDVGIAVWPQRWEIGNEICGLSKGCLIVAVSHPQLWSAFLTLPGIFNLNIPLSK